MHLISYLAIFCSLYVQVSLAIRFYSVADLSSDSLVQRQVEAKDLSQSDTSIVPTGVSTSLQEALSPTSSLTQAPAWTGTAPVHVTPLPSTSSAFQSEDSLASNQEPVSASFNTITIASLTINLTDTSSSGIAVSSASALDTLPVSTPESLTTSLLPATSISAQVSDNLSAFPDPTSSTSSSIDSSSAIDQPSQFPSTQVSAFDNSSIFLSPSPIIITSIVTATNGGTTIIITTTIPGSIPTDSTTMSSTPLPKSSMASGTETVPTSLPPAHNIEALIGGISYHLPSSNEAQFEILLTDGTLAQLFMDRIIMHGRTFSIPASLSGTQEVKVGGESITAQPGPSTKPPEDNGGGHQKGLFGALGALIGSATAAVGSIATLSTGAAAFVSGTGGVTASLTGSFPGAITDVEKIVFSLNGIQDTFPTASLSQAGLQVFSDAQSLGRRSLDWMKGMEATLGKFDSLPADTQSLVRTNVGTFVKASGFLDQTKEAMKSFQDYHWEDAEVPTATPDPTGTPDVTNTGSAEASKGATSASGRTDTELSTTTTTTGQSSSSSSATPSPTDDVDLYCIITKLGTSIERFNTLISQIDDSKGEQYICSQSQIYLCRINTTQAQEIERLNDFIDYIAIQAVDESIDGEQEHFRATESISFRETSLEQPRDEVIFKKRSRPSHTPRVVSRSLLPPDTGAPWWKKSLSAPPRDLTGSNIGSTNDPPYVADDSGGRGVTIYVIDDGFDISIPDLQADGRKIEHFIVPKHLAAPNIPDSRFVEVNPETRELQIEGGLHGTQMASLAGGKLHGIAPNADLFLVKLKAAYTSANSPTFIQRPGYKYAAIYVGLDKVETHITQRMQQNGNAKSVINMSWGVNTLLTSTADRRQELTLLQLRLERFVEFCRTRQIPLVVSAGNREGVTQVTDSLPQKLSQPADTMILVGAITQTGEVWTGTVWDPTRIINVFAPGKDISNPSNGNIMIVQHGTSQAAAITSGLIAYYSSLPNLISSIYNQPNSGGMKSFLRQHAWLRTSAVIPVHYPPPIAVYNLARGDPVHSPNACVMRRAKYGRREEPDRCTLASTLATSFKSTIISITPAMTSVTISDASIASSQSVSDTSIGASDSTSGTSISASQFAPEVSPSTSRMMSKTTASAAQSISGILITLPESVPRTSISASQSVPELSTTASTSEPEMVTGTPQSSFKDSISASQSASQSLVSASDMESKTFNSASQSSMGAVFSSSEAALGSSISSSQAAFEPSTSVTEYKSPSATAPTRPNYPSTASDSQSDSGPPPNISQSTPQPTPSFTQSINLPEIILSVLSPLFVPSYTPPSSAIVTSSTTQSVDLPAALSSGLGVMLGPQTSVPSSIVWPAPLLPLKTRTKKDTPTTSIVR